MRSLNILGSTGSIGTQALQVAALHPDRFTVRALTARRNKELLFEQVRTFRPEMAGLVEPIPAEEIPADCRFCRWVMGPEALHAAAAEVEADMVLVAVVGIAGLQSVMDALGAGRQVLLANKEALVTGGHLVMDAARRAGKPLLPVDSEHSAIFQCMLGQDRKHIHKLLLTASGGPFRGKTREELKKVTLADAMKHPTWNMGMKVTLDSATMFNKGLEVIEAHWLFNVDYDDIEVIVQPQSLIHSMVEYDDGSIMAQIGNPDMRLPIQFALTYPERLPSPSRQYVNWRDIASIIIEKPDLEVFRSLKMAYEAGKQGGTAGTAFNAANEEAIRAFIAGRISFLSIYDVVEETLSRFISREIHSYEDIMEADRLARKLAESEIRRIAPC